MRVVPTTANVCIPSKTSGILYLLIYRTQHRGETAPVEFAQYVSRDSSEEEIFTLQASHPDINKNNARMSLLLNGFPQHCSLTREPASTCSPYMYTRKSNNWVPSRSLRPHVSTHTAVANLSRFWVRVTSLWMIFAKWQKVLSRICHRQP